MSTTSPQDLDEATDEVVLYQAADIRKLRQLQELLQQALFEEMSGTAEERPEFDDIPSVEAGRAYDEYHAGALERATRVTITALPRRRWREMLKTHLPRDDVRAPETGELLEHYELDRQHGFNVDTMADDLVPASIPLVYLDSDGQPQQQFASDAAREEWIEQLSDPRWNRIFSAAVRLNEDGGPDPKVSASSVLAQMSSVISRSPTESASPSTSSTTSEPDSDSSTSPAGSGSS